MDQQNQQTVVSLTRKLEPALRKPFLQFCRHVIKKIKANNISRASIVDQLKKELSSSSGVAQTEVVDLLFVKSVLLDLLAVGWEIRMSGADVLITLPLSYQNKSLHASKETVRLGHLAGRDAQLREESVAEFIKGMERRRLNRNGWHSIYSLMRDGRELSEKLFKANAIKGQEERFEELGKVISPYVQFVEGDNTCEHTGLRLGDVWRYFRHTWVNEYKSLPGRSTMILIRDAACRNHPVIGIAALGSSMVQLSVRDKWVGWDSETFVEQLRTHPSAKLAKWLVDSLEGLIEGIYIDDLVKEGLLTTRDLQHPTASVIDKLRQESELAKKDHREDPQTDIHKRQKGEAGKDVNWIDSATSSLFRMKRCQSLARLLSIRRVLQDSGLLSGTKGELDGALKAVKAVSAIGQLVRMIKAEHVGVDIMDITVCGAIAPYNLLLGGKLVCMLLISPEVTQHYSKKYQDQASLIASSMKGRAVVRKPNLVLLGTTSLYGSGSSQYNRVKIPAEEVGGRTGEFVCYFSVGHTEGFGTYHFSKETITLGSILTSRRQEGIRVNSIFGEGVNPLLRKIRDALDHVGLPSDPLLWHGNRRETYAVALARNFREVLLGIDKNPNYIIPQTKAGGRTRSIADYWRRRWLSPRIDRPGILEGVAKHTLIYPITHGAQVPRSFETEEVGALFALWQD
jgi:hypothetical protein